MTTSWRDGYHDPDTDSPTTAHMDSDDTDGDALNSSSLTPLLLSDVPNMLSSTSTLTHSMLKAASAQSSHHTLSSFADLCLSTVSSSGHPSASYRSAIRKRQSVASCSLSACALLCFFCVALTVLFVVGHMSGVVNPFTFGPLSASSLLQFSHNSSTDGSRAAAFFPLEAMFGRVSSRSTAASSWPFSLSTNATRSHTTWVGLLALLFSQPVESAATHEAVLLDGYAVASFDDMVEVMDRRAGRTTSTGHDATSQKVAVHVVTSAAHASLQTELAARLRSAGYDDCIYHSTWSRERLVEERDDVTRWLYPGFANVSSTPPAAVTDAHVHMMEHISVLQAIATSPASSPSLAIVLEDDAVFTPQFLRRMAWMTSALPADFDVVFFGGCLNLHSALKDWRITAAANSETACEPERQDGVLADCSVLAGHVTPLLVPTSRSRCSSGYLVSRTSAARLLVALQAATRKQTFFVPIDHSFNEAFAQLPPSNRSTVYQLEPPASYESKRLLQPNEPTATQSQQRTLDIVDHNAAVAFVQPPAAHGKHPNAVHGVLVPSAGGPMCDLLCGWSRPFSAAAVSRSQSAVGTDWSSYISPTSFRDMSDWVHFRHDEALPPHDRLRGVNDSVAIACLPTGSIIYVQATMLLKFFTEVHSRLTKPYFLITGSADQETPAQGVRWFDDLSADGVTPKLLHWFGQNGNSNHPRFTQIPIGINFHEMADALDLTLRGQGSLVEGERYTADDGSLDFAAGERVDNSRFRPHIEAFRWSNVGDYDRSKSLLVNFALDSSPGKRGPPLVYACGNETARIAGKPWAECVSKSKGVSQYVSTMPAIYHHNSRFRFHLSPEGNGLDCHRTWEALYLGVVPIVKSGPLDPLLADTPAWIVDEWEDVTEDSMEAHWQETNSAWRGRVVERLHFSYWKSRVIAVARRELEQWKLPVEASWLDVDLARRRCWGPINQRQDNKAMAATAAA